MIKNSVLLMTAGLFALFFVTAQSAQARQRCYARNPPGRIAACGTKPGTFRPQPVTLSSRGRIIERPGSWYAPVGNRQQYYQYYPGTDGQHYGQREPNPFNQSGRISVTRTVRHLYYTRICTRF